MAAYILKQGDIITIAFVRKLAMNRRDAARCRLTARICSIAAQVWPLVTPTGFKQGSWLNLIESFFGKMARTMGYTDCF